MGRLTGLDALRGIAALCVLALHLENWLGYRIAPGGHLAVDFFFLLSGFVMARTYEAGFKTNLSVSAFLFLRARRLWPLIILASVIGYFAAGASSPAILLLAILCIPSFWGSQIYPLNGPQWSIFFEVLANVFHAGILYKIRSSHLLIFFALNFTILAIQSFKTNHIAFGSTQELFLGGIPRVLTSYTLGIILYRRWKDTAPIKVKPVITAMTMPIVSIIPIISGQVWLYDLVFVLLVNPLLLAGGVQWDAGRSGRLLGVLSYPVYILHIPALLALERIQFLFLT